jgi:hypothetical protein
MARKKHSPKEIEQLYDTIPRVNQERNDFLLPQVVDFVQSLRWMNIRPEYQRRLVWDRKKKSKFIESLLMNIPIPPVFLYEHELSRYEVMDGQQRINSILEFYNNQLKLTGLETWSALNGATRSDCPEKIKRGLDRRRLSATVLLAESSDSEGKYGKRLRQEVFERLNTGGQRLNAQEMRNSTYSGKFNDLLVELAGNSLFDDIWGIPRYDEHYDRDSGQISPELAQNAHFKRMQDCEIVLRFFALRHKSWIRGSVKTILDRCMEAYQDETDVGIDVLRQDFLKALTLSHHIFGERTFQMKGGRGRWGHSQPLYDAVMVAVDRLKTKEKSLVSARVQIRTALQNAMEDQDNYEIVVGRPNTAAAIKARLDLVHDLMSAELS